MKRKIFFSAALLSAVVGITGCMSPLPQLNQAIQTAEVGYNEDIISNDDIKTEYSAFYDYLKEIYKNADEYINGFPVYYSDRDTSQSTTKGMMLYKEFVITDLDKDGKDELIICAGRHSEQYINRNALLRDGEPIEENVFDKDEALNKLTDMFFLCEEDESDPINRVSEAPDRIMLGTKDGLSSKELIFLSNGCIVTEADKKSKLLGIKYDKVGFFNKAVFADAGISAVSDDSYIRYWYNDEYARIDYNWYPFEGRDFSHEMTLSDEEYEKHLRTIESGDIVEIDKEACRSFTSSGIGISSEELQPAKKPEDDIFLKYLADIYNKNDIINGFPVEIEIEDDVSYGGSWNAYKNYSIADFDGDGTDELLIQKYVPYTGGMWAMGRFDSLTEYSYPIFDMYEISETGEVKDRDEDPYANPHGDIWLGRSTDNSIDRSCFDFFGNGVFRYCGEDYESQDFESYYIYDDDIFRQIEELGHLTYTEYEGMEPRVFGRKDKEAALCYLHKDDGTISRLVGSHQDASQDTISYEDYISEVNVLTGGNKLEAYFRMFKADSLGIAARSDTFEKYVCKESDAGLADITLTGTIYTDNTTKDAHDNPEPAVVLKLDKGFAYVTDDYYEVRVDEVQLGTDVSVRDTLDFKRLEGRRVNVTGSVFTSKMSKYHRPLVMLVKTAKEAR